MTISVIIPVYNASNTILRAVLSALDQPQVAIILLVEDGSVDNSLSICKALEQQYSKVHLFFHPNHTNMGPGASRNLTIPKLRTPYVAFLDADDYYLPHRFDEALNILEKDLTVDGIYGTSNYLFDSLKDKKSYQSVYGTQPQMQIDYVVAPEKLFEHLTGAGSQYFSIITLLLRTPLIQGSIEFDKSLCQHQDTDFIWQLSRKTNLVSDRLYQPIATINIHGKNRVLNRSVARKYRFELMAKWMKIANGEILPAKSSIYILRNYLDNHPFVQTKIKVLQKLQKTLLLIPTAIKYPALFLRILTKS